MEFPFNINSVLPDEVTLIRGKDVTTGLASRSNHQERNNDNQLKSNLSKIIDNVGIASSKAQKLHGPITSSLKLKASDNHLYILKDVESPSGCVIGIIRVGCKRLFLSDIYGQLHECQPLCVLDFYVHESKQRNGYGSILFNHVVQTEKVAPHQLAIDRPSEKFINFLKKHYSLDNPIPQMNKFVVFEAFFQDLSVVGGIDVNRRRSAPGYRKMYCATPDSRNSSSASLIRIKNRSRCGVSNELSKFQLVPPINRKAQNDEVEYSNPDDVSAPEPTSLLLTARSQVSHGVRKVDPASKQYGSNDSSLSNFSRHSINRDSSTHASVRNGHNYAQRNGYGFNTKTHTLLQSSPAGQRMTSLDNPFSAEVRTASTSSSNSNNGSYTIDNILNELNGNRRILGTGWNVFGVPASQQHSSNPYSKMQKRGYPS